MRIEIPVTESSFRYKLQNRFTSQRNAYSHANGIPIPIRPESLFRSNGMSILIDRNTHLYDASSIRAFILSQTKGKSRPAVKEVVSITRVFLRYLIAQGKCRTGMD